MTSATCDVGTVSASRNYDTKYPYLAFNYNLSYSQHWEVSYTQTATTSDYIMFTFNKPRHIYSWVVVPIKGVAGYFNANIIAVLTSGEEKIIGSVSNIQGTTPYLYTGSCDVGNVQAIKLMPTYFDSYNQVALIYLNVFGK